jgi:hypothetical protein
LQPGAHKNHWCPSMRLSGQSVAMAMAWHEHLVLIVEIFFYLTDFSGSAGYRVGGFTLCIAKMGEILEIYKVRIISQRDIKYIVRIKYCRWEIFQKYLFLCFRDLIFVVNCVCNWIHNLTQKIKIAEKIV